LSILAAIALISLVAVALVTRSVQAQPAAGEVRVTLFHDTHLHGNLEGPNDITFAHYVGLINQLRAELPAPGYSLFVGNGDDLAPSLMSSVFRGDHIVDSFNAAGLDVETFGNHEFDYGPDNLRRILGMARYPYVSANVRDAATGDAFGAEVGARRWLIKEVGGVRFGFTGLAPEDTSNIANTGPGVTVLDPVAAMQEVVPQMRADGAQIVVLLSHLCTEHTEVVVALVDGIDVAVGDHCSRVLEQPRVINGAIVSRRGDELRLLGQLDLYISGGRIARHTYMQHTVRADGPVDAQLGNIMASYQARLDAELLAEVGITNAPLDATREAVRGAESTAGNLVADALRDWEEADIGLTNGGGIRGERVFPAGLLRKRDVAELLPFANYATLLRLSGAQVVQALENGVSQVAEGGGRFPQVSGVAFAYDPTVPVGGRVREVTVGGAPLDADAQYTVATNDFMASGGDGYSMLQESEVLIPSTAGPLLANLVMEYVQARGTITPTVEGRIRALP
jgi:2',3'-cyclic-nucleotide 2'-phosphodiesterase/3'-nucleotidase